MEKVVMVFEKPDSYFFPTYQGKVFSPFCVKNRSLGYLIYKGMSILNLPGRHKYWGDWKEAAKQADKVILFDYGYQKGMETYIKKVNPRCSVYFFCWNMIDRHHQGYRLFTDQNAIYGTDKRDCEKYGFHYNHIFYPKEAFLPYETGKENRLFFMGYDKGRGEELLQLKHLLEKAGILCDVRVVTARKDREALAEILCDQPLDYQDYVAEVKKAGVLLDVCQAGQTALTMRVMEALFYSKKLITTNADMVNYDFYDPDNIFVISGAVEKVDGEALREFVHRPYREVPWEILEKYSFEHWLAGFQN